MTETVVGDLLAGLSSPSRQKKLQALQSIKDLHRDEKSVDQLSDVFKLHSERLILLFNDPSESIQQKAIDLFTAFVEKKCAVDGSMPSLLNMLLAHLVEKETHKSSEEIRLMEVNLLVGVCEAKGSSMKFYADEVLKICENCLSDNFGDIRVATCVCLKVLIPNIKEEFFFKSDPIIDALLATFTHNQSKVRCANTDLFAYALHYGNYKRISDVWRSLAQRVIDSHHAVRRSVFSVLHFFMMQFRDRYSHWNRFVPLFICGLFDELTEIRAECLKMWQQIGDQYEQENRDDTKHEELYAVLVENYPENTMRSNIGCRMLVKKVFFNVLQSTLNDLKDWQDHVRIQAIKLMHQLILHAENHVTILVDKIINALPQVAKDENRVVVQEAMICAKLVGHFVEPKVLFALLLLQMDEASHVVILNGILQGVSIAGIREHSFNVLEALKRNSITRQKSQLFYINECCRCLLDRIFPDTESSAFDLFHVLIHVRGLSIDHRLLHNVEENLRILCSKIELRDIQFLYARFSKTLLLTTTCRKGYLADWSSESLDYQIFHRFIMDAGLEIFIENFDILSPVLRKNLLPEKSAKIRANIYKLIIDVVQNSEELLKKTTLDGKFVEDMFIPNLSWKGGRSESALRMICISCLAVLLDRRIISDAAFLEAKPVLLPKLLSLARDERPSTHRAVMRLLRLYLKKDSGITEEEMKNICSALLKGLDDENAVRFEAFEGLKEMFNYFATRPEYSLHNKTLLEESCRICLIHIDDPDDAIGSAAVDCLKIGALIVSPYLAETILSQKHLYHNPQRYSLLEQHLQNSFCVRE